MSRLPGALELRKHPSRASKHHPESLSLLAHHYISGTRPEQRHRRRRLAVVEPAKGSIPISRAAAAHQRALHRGRWCLRRQITRTLANRLDPAALTAAARADALAASCLHLTLNGSKLKVC